MTLLLTGREPPIIDAKAETIDETDRPLLDAATSAQPQFRRAARFVRSFQAPLQARITGLDAARPGVARRTSCRKAESSLKRLQQPSGKPCLQALHPEPLSRAGAPFDRHAARLHSVA